MPDLKPLLTLLGGRIGWLPAAVAWMGAIRIVLKPFSARIQAALTAKVAAAVKSPDPADLQFIDGVLQAKWYRLTAFALDMVASFKLPTHADVLSMRAVIGIVPSEGGK